MTKHSLLTARGFRSLLRSVPNCCKRIVCRLLSVFGIANRGIRISLLTGAGISRAAGLPGTQEITDAVLGAEVFHRHTGGSWVHGESPSFYTQNEQRELQAVTTLCRHLACHCAKFYGISSQDEEFFGRHTVNYEDIYYLLAQIGDSDGMEYENPALDCFIRDLQGWKEETRLVDALIPPWNFSQLVRESRSYVESVVQYKLSQTESVDGSRAFSLIEEMNLDASVSHIDLFTLNHDTLFEDHAKEQKIHIIDGFRAEQNGVRYWDRNSYSIQKSKKLHLFKLHGSVDWWNFCTTEKFLDEDGLPSGHHIHLGVGIVNTGDPDHATSPSGERLIRDPVNPVALIGTFNKILQYHYGIFAELQNEFFARLPSADYLIVCGYSFGDKAINSRICDWIGASSNHLMVVIEPRDEDQVKLCARGAIRHSWDALAKRGQLTHVAQKVEDVSWNDVKHVLENS